jgi:hypothetical protein
MRPWLALSVVLLALPGCLALSGCSRVKATATVAGDGSFERVVRLTVGKDQFGLGQAPRPSDLLAFDPAWKVETGADEKEDWIEGRLAGLPGPGAKLTLRKPSGEKVLEGVAESRRLDDGTIEYTETYTWVGKPSGDPPKPNPEFRAAAKAALAALELTDAQLDELETAAVRALHRAVFGPSEPLLMQLLTSPDMAARKMKTAAGLALIERAAPWAEGRMAPEELRAAVRVMVDAVDSPVDPAKEAQEAGQPGEDEEAAPPVNLTVFVSGPGRVVETNGIVDPLTGEVYWSFFDLAAEIGPVVLKAVYKP